MPSEAMEYREFINASALELETKQRELIEKFEQLGELRHEYDISDGRIAFSDAETGEKLLTYKAITVGSYNLDQQTWQWAWGKSGLTREEMIGLIRQVSVLAEAFPDNADLINPAPFKTDELFGQEVAGALVELVNGEGLYKSEYKELDRFWIYFVLVRQH